MEQQRDEFEDWQRFNDTFDANVADRIEAYSYEDAGDLYLDLDWGDEFHNFNPIETDPDLDPSDPWEDDV